MTKKKNLPLLKIDEKRKLNLKQELFCQLFASDKEFFGNGTQSYIEAYDIDITRKGAYDAARACAYDQLTKPHITARINELLESAVLNDAFVDKQLGFVIAQNAEFPSKIAAIKEYNKLKQRIVDITKNINRLPFGETDLSAIIMTLPQERQDYFYGVITELIREAELSRSAATSQSSSTGKA